MPTTSTPRFKRGGRPHKVLASLAAHPDGLTSRQLAELHGADTGRPMLTRYGTALRTLRDAGHVIPAGTRPSGRRKTLAIVYQLTDAGRRYLGTLEAPRREPPERERAGYPWVEDAARRNHAGESVHALSLAYKVDASTVRRALERHGVPVLQHVGNPHRNPRPEWAAEAAQRYRDGETRLSLCAVYGVCDRRMVKVLKEEGVILRSRRQVLQLLISARGEDPDRQQPGDAAPSRHDHIASAVPEDT